jgi:hypothetical protein
MHLFYGFYLLTAVKWKLLKISPLAPFLVKERGTRNESGSPSLFKEKGLGDVVNFLST